VILDGGMGRELRFRGVENLSTIWSANALLVAPEVVREVHADYIAAGAQVITTNTYGIIRHELAREGVEHRLRELNELAGRLAVKARDAATHDVWIAGSLPPLNGSYRRPTLGDRMSYDSRLPGTGPRAISTWRRRSPLRNAPTQNDELVKFRGWPESYGHCVALWEAEGGTPRHSLTSSGAQFGRCIEFSAR